MNTSWALPQSVGNSKELYDTFMMRAKETSKESTVFEDIVHYMNAVICGMKTIIEVHGYIEKYKNQGGFADFVAKMVSNDHLTESVLIAKLEETIQRNAILDQYKIVMRSFIRHYFPFVPKFETKFEANHFKFNDATSISVDDAIQLIKCMQEHHNNKTTTPKSLTYATFGGRGKPPFYV